MLMFFIFKKFYEMKCMGSLPCSQRKKSQKPYEKGNLFVFAFIYWLCHIKEKNFDQPMDLGNHPKVITCLLLNQKLCCSRGLFSS